MQTYFSEIIAQTSIDSCVYCYLNGMLGSNSLYGKQ